jgi:AcrR family transcriptional regulator
MAGCCAAAGVTKVTFYRHFPAKNDLILAFLQQRHQRWMLRAEQDAVTRAGAGIKQQGCEHKKKFLFTGVDRICRGWRDQSDFLPPLSGQK